MIFINIILFASFALTWILTRKYESKLVNGLDEKQYPLKQLYSMGFFLMDKLSLASKNNKRQNPLKRLDEPLKALYVGQQLELVKRLYLCKKIVLILTVLFVANIFSLIITLQGYQNNQLIEGSYIQRPGYNEGSKEVNLHVNVLGENEILYEDEILIEIEEKQYNQNDIIQLFKEAKEYIDSVILKENESAMKILSDLDFISKVPNTSITVKWITEDYALIDRKGGVHNEELTEGTLISVTAVLTYYDTNEEYTRYFKILPKEFTKEELTKKYLEEALNKVNTQSQTEDILILPKELEQKDLIWTEPKKKSGGSILILGIILALLLYFVMDRDLNDKITKRNQEMLLDYPDIINKFTLLVSAGMSLSNAWCKISKDYKEKGIKKRYAYEEMGITYGELMVGTSEIVAYERFGRRVKLLPYLRFAALLAQNVKKGSADLLNQLELEAAESFEERKELAKRIGEEAGTKLLLPMMLMLVLVLAIVMVPAFLSFQF